MNLKRQFGVLVAAVLLGSGLVGCAVEDERPVPYEPQVTHAPKPKKTDDAGADEDGLDDDGSGEDGTDENGADEDGAAESGSEVEALEPPPIPDAIYEETLEGAEAAARYYVRALEYGFLSNDPQPLERICLEASQVCATLMAEMERASENKYTVVGGTYDDEEAERVIPVEDGFVFEIPIAHEGFEVFNERNESIQVESGFYTLFKIFSKYDSDRWQIRAVDYEDIDQ